MASSEPDNPARPPPGQRLCDLAEIPQPGARGFRFRAAEALFAGFVVRSAAGVEGFVDRCPHAGWPLASPGERYLTRDGRHILCAGHGALFDLGGACVAGPCFGDRLAPWAVAVRDGGVYTA